MDPRVGLDGRENISPTGIRSPHHLAYSESLYRLRYPGPLHCLLYITNFLLVLEEVFIKNETLLFVVLYSFLCSFIANLTAIRKHSGQG